MLQICPRLPGQKFEDPLFEEEILSFIRDLGHTGEIKVLTDVNVNHMRQPWRSFDAIINRCLSGKTTGIDSLRLSRAQIIWGIYHKKNVDYVYLLWEDLIYQVGNKNSKKNNDMNYPRFSKVIIDYFMTKDQSISRRNKMFWHTARDDPMFNTIRVISKHEDIQIYGTIPPDELINQEIKDSEAYKQYYAIASGAEPSKAKTKYKKKADRSDTSSKPKFAPTVKGKRLKTPSKVTKSGKKRQSASVSKAKELETLSEVALSKHEQMKIATKRSKTQFHSSHASGSGDGADTQSEVLDEQQKKDGGTDEGAGDKPEVPDVPKYTSEGEEESWTFSEGDDDDDDNDEHDLEDERDNANDDDKNDSEETESDDDSDDFEEKEEEELYRDLNLNLERRDAGLINAQTNQDTEYVHVTLTAEPPVVQQQSSFVSSDLVSKYINPSPDIVFVAVVTPSSVTTPPQPPVPIIQTLQQTPDSTTTTPNPTTTLPEIPNFASLFGFEQRMKDAVNVAIQLQSNKLREEAQAENDEFLNQINSNIKAIIKDQVKAQVSKILPKVEKYVTESLGAEVLVRTTNQPHTSYAVVASLLEFDLKKILIDKIEENKSMNRSDVQKNLYNALIDLYNSDKDLFTSYGDVITLKRGRDDQDKD
ncbi:hypothetical protein Tco_1441384, partial [Tanacetum coccineum]